MAELDWGIGVDPTPAGFAEGVARLVDESPPARTADPEGRFERRSLSQRLAAVLDGVATRRLG